MPKELSFSVKNKESGSFGDFRIVLPEPIKNVTKLFIENIIIPKNWYTIMSGINDTIPFNVGSTDYIASLTEGLYSSLDLATEIQTQLNTIYTVDNLFTCTVSALTKKYNISHSTTSFILSFDGLASSITRTLGFNANDTPNSTSHTADNIYNMSFSSKIFILSNTLGSAYHSIAGIEHPVLYKRGVLGSFGEFIPYEVDRAHTFITYANPKTLKIIDIQILFEDLKTVIPFNSDDISFDFYCETLD